MIKHPTVDLLINTNGEVFTLDGIPRKLQDYGYMKVMVNRKSYAVHRLVAETFIPNPENKPMVNHINGDRKDNRVENLEWVNAMENMQKASIAGTLVHNKKQIDIYTVYGDLVCTKESVSQVAKLFKMLPCAVSSNIKRQSMTNGYFIVPHGEKPQKCFAKITGC